MENTPLSQYGKMCPEHSAATKEKISGSCWKNWQESGKLTFQSLNLNETKNGSLVWAKSGIIGGNGWSIVWRTLDAQYWGVPQRRRRIAVVVDFGGQRAGEILFERKGVSGDSESSIPPWKGIARNPANRSAGYDRMVEGERSCLNMEENGRLVIPINTQIATRHISLAETLEECCPTLNCNHETPIVFESHHKDARYTQQKETSPTCLAYWGTGGNNMPMVAKRQPLRWIVRRLTPTECERLQGFPDDWTAIDSFTDKYGVEHKTSGWLDNKGKWHKAADSPRYKALGNSIALPQWWWITCKMAKYLPEHATMGSLFDGIGGFPLVWETRHGKGTALWASEIEAFPIAVTEKHFS